MEFFFLEGKWLGKGSVRVGLVGDFYVSVIDFKGELGFNLDLSLICGRVRF